MAQWINVLRNNSFINPTRLPLLCRNSRAIALAELGLTAGWLAVDLRLAIMKPLKAQWMISLHTYLKSNPQIIQNEFKII